ncbi:MAG: TetR/AcrR family transcriptional regulator [Rhodococcus sp. (in: high G+C Gram-positive bacteria)]|uniref:TetR/AcrR family transcriptional regulator n=1 Tax=Rhodococcus sp. TaxID=1831 RepID=UPI002ADD0B30|nr:TetR/AcrR family transcriptional regulator [Rhodococcus sp. (in: high G+C Gram-positive bacteria)]
MQERSRRTQDALIQAATELVAEVGYHRATTRAIAERAGVSEGTIYRHFPDKQALFATAVLAGQREVTEWMTQLPGRAGTAPIVDLLDETFTQLSRLREAVLPMNDAVPVARPHVTADQLESKVHEAGGPPLLLAQYIAAESSLGNLPTGLDPTRTAVLLLSSFLGVQTSPLAGAEGLSERDIRGFAEFVVHGLVAVKQ